MKKSILFLTAFFISIGSFAQTYNWTYSSGGSGWDDVKSTHLGNDNGTVMTGMFSNTATFGATTLTSTAYQDAFVAKYDQQGNVLWAKAISGNEQDWGYKVTTDNNNNVYVTGYFQSTALYFTPTDSIVKNVQSSRNVFLAKYNSNGVFQWAKLGSGGATNAYLTSRSVVTDNQNNIIISGDYNKQIQFGASTLPNTNTTNIFMVKFDPSGNVIWTKAGVSNSICWFADLATDASNNIYATGKISTAITFGATTITNNQGDDMVIGKFDASGNLLWMDVVGKSLSASTTANNLDCGSSVKVDGSGNVFVGGSLVDTTYYDANLNMLITKQFAFVAKYSNGGVQQWLKKFGNDEKDNINAIDLDANGDLYAIGMYKGVFNVGGIALPNGASTNAFVAKFNKLNGNTIFAYQLGVSAAEVEGWGIGVNQQNGNVYTSGNYRGSCAFNANTINPQGVWDIFVVLLNNSVIQSTNDIVRDFNIELFPNPATTTLSILASNDIDLYNSTIKVFSSDGKLMNKSRVLSDKLIDVSDLKAGNYWLEIVNDGKRMIKLFSKY